METLHLTQRVRPLRLLFWVSEDQEDQVVLAFQLNCALWGGILNPVVSVEQGEDFLDSMFEASHADFGINLSGKSWPSSIARKYQRRLKSAEGYGGLLSREGELYDFQLGCDMRPLFADHWERHGRYRALQSQGHNADFLLLEGVNDYWQKYTTVVSGTYPVDFKYDYSTMYSRATGCEQIALEERTLTSFGFLRASTPLRFTLAELRCRHPSARGTWDSHIIFIGEMEDPRHWLDFWNLRSCGSYALLVPWDKTSELATQIQEYMKQGNYPISNEMENTTILQKASTLSNERFEEAVSAIKVTLSQESPMTLRTWIPSFGLAISDTATRVHGPLPQESVICTAYKQEDLVPISGNRIDFKLALPKFLVPFKDNFNRTWAIALSGRDPSGTDLWVSLPPFPSVSRMLEAEYYLMLTDFKLCPRENLVVIRDEGATSDFFFIGLPNTIQVFRAVLGQFGLNLIDYSEKGRYAAAIESMMGGLWGGVTLLRDRGVRSLLQRLAANEGRDHLPRRDLERIVGELSQLVREQDARREAVSPALILDTLITKGVLRPGLQFKCEHCYRQGWYDLSQIGTSFACKYCFEEQPTPILDRKKWRYRASGVFGTQDVGYGSLAVICTSLFFRLNFRPDARHIFSFEFDSPNGTPGEVDLAVIRTGFDQKTEIAFCECKSSDFSAEDFEKLERLATVVPGSVTCAATLKESFSDEEKEWAVKLWDADHPVILLSGLDLEYRDAGLEGVEGRHRRFHSFKALADATKVKYLSEKA